MPFKLQDSNNHLHKDVILSKISEYDIFRYYCSPFKRLGEKFCSELRNDVDPSACVSQLDRCMYYKDFGYPDHGFNCFEYVMFKYGISYVDALKLISQDFSLGLVHESAVGKAPAKRYSYTPVPRPPMEIRVRFRAWNKLDAEYWGQYGISRSTLLHFGVRPIDYYWLGQSRFRAESLAYQFAFADGVKLYQPKSTEAKWYSNAPSTTIQGYSQLPETGEIVIITSSLKDAMVLHSLQYPAIAPQSETVRIDSAIIEELRERFTNIVILYDNDYTSATNPGQTVAIKLAKEFSLKNIYIPSSLESKDISDLVAAHGISVAAEFLKESI